MNEGKRIEMKMDEQMDDWMAGLVDDWMAGFVDELMEA